MRDHRDSPLKAGLSGPRQQVLNEGSQSRSNWTIRLKTQGAGDYRMRTSGPKAAGPGSELMEAGCAFLA
jgi:hypothetical protein